MLDLYNVQDRYDQDFAKIRPEPLLEKKPASNPPAWSLMITGVVLGITIGVFACVLLYLSGRVPPLSQPATATAKLINRVSADNEPGATAESDPEETALEYEFYRELRSMRCSLMQRRWTSALRTPIEG